MTFSTVVVVDLFDNHRYCEDVTTDTALHLDPLGVRLLEAAAEVFTEFGYDGAKVAEISRRAGVTTGAIYSRYRGKADLMAAALEHSLADEIERLLPEAPDGGAALLSSLGTHLTDDRDASEWLLLEAMVASRRDPELAETIRGRFNEDNLRIGKILQQAKDDGHIDRDLSIDSLAIFCTALGLGMRTQQLLQLTPPDADEWETVIALLLAAVRPQPHTTGGPS